jgi:GT2 family glycosyltransferase
MKSDLSPNTVMEKNPVITAILLNYRDSTRSLSCIQSLLAERIDYVMIWDNSADGGVSASEIQEKNPDKDRVYIEVSGRNLGFAAGVNRAVETALHRWPGTWVLLINNDAVLLAGGLEIMREALRKSAEAKLVAPRINNAGVIGGKPYYQRISGLLFESYKPGCFIYPSGCCLLIATERLCFPLFDERFFMYGEDWALGSRLSKTGGVVYLSETLVNHEGSASSGLGSEFYEKHIVAAHFLMADLLAGSGFRFFVYFIARVFTLSLRAMVRACRFRSFIPVKALWHGLLLALVGGQKPSSAKIQGREIIR